jgi:hypothetical protein
MVPGSNLLIRALQLIASQTISYYRFISRSLNSVGQDITLYADPVTLYGSFQAVDRKLYDQYGLDLQKSYYTFYSSSNISDIGRDVSGDQLIFGGQRFQVESNNDWFKVDGWKGVLCVAIQDAGN